MSDVILENAGITHVHVLAALHQTSFETPWSADEIGKLLTHPGTNATLAMDMHHTPVGFVLVRQAADEAEILTLCVDPQYRAQKIATRMVDSLKAEFKTQKVKKIFLEVADDNFPAIRVYQNCGFNTVAKRPGYYNKHGQSAKDALIMACSW